MKQKITKEFKVTLTFNKKPPQSSKVMQETILEALIDHDLEFGSDTRDYLIAISVTKGQKVIAFDARPTRP